MNNTDAKKISETITNEQIADMLNEAKNHIEDWREVSSVNKAMTKGYAWNILAKDFNVNVRPHPMHRKNLVWEFGDYLPESLKPKKAQRYKYGGVINHQDPIFDNYAGNKSKE